MHRQPSLPFLALIMLPLAAATASADTTTSLEGWPAWVHEAMDKEVKRLKYRNVKTPDKSVSTRLPGKPEAPQPMDGSWYFIADIKAESPLECYLFPESKDLANLTDIIAEANIEAVAGDPATVGNRRIYHTSAGAAGGMPYLALEWLYTVQRDDQMLIGFTKVRAATKGETTLVCNHNAIGYRETFANAFTEFVTTTQVADATAAPFYEEIAELDMNGLGSGVIHTSYTIDEDGDIALYSAESVLVPVDAATLTTNDSYTISYSTPEGKLFNAHSIGVENDELAVSMSLQRNDAGDWVSSGTMQGKELSFEIDGTLQPASEWEQLAITRNLFAGDDTTASALIWTPAVDPTQFLEATMTRDDADIERQATVTVGPLSYSGRFDESGNLVDADMIIGPVTINVERAWSQGSLLR